MVEVVAVGEQACEGEGEEVDDEEELVLEAVPSFWGVLDVLDYDEHCVRELPLE